MRALPRKLLQQLHLVSGMFVHGSHENLLSSIVMHSEGRPMTLLDEYMQALPVVVAGARERNVT